MIHPHKISTGIYFLVSGESSFGMPFDDRGDA